MAITKPFMFIPVRTHYTEKTTSYHTYLFTTTSFQLHVKLHYIEK